MDSLIVLGFYAAAALVLFGITIGVLRASSTVLVLPFEYATWLIPGAIYWVIPILIYEARWLGIDLETPPKTLANFFEPILVAVLFWFAFLARLLAARRQPPERNREAAYWCVIAGVVIAIAVLFYVPPLPE